MRGQIGAALFAAGVPGFLWLLQILAVPTPTSIALALRGLAIVAALASAGLVYQVFANHPPRTPRTIIAVVTSLIGGASVAAAVTSASGAQIYGSRPLSTLGWVLLFLAATLLTIEWSARQPTSKE